MKTHSTKNIEEALTMYRETVSPSLSTLQTILKQIPEKKEGDVIKRAIRSPYRWAFATQIFVLCAIIFFVYPNAEEGYKDSEFYTIDRSLDNYETKINNEDYENMLADYNNL